MRSSKRVILGSLDACLCYGLDFTTHLVQEETTKIAFTDLQSIPSLLMIIPFWVTLNRGGGYDDASDDDDDDNIPVALF